MPFALPRAGDHSTRCLVQSCLPNISQSAHGASAMPSSSSSSVQILDSFPPHAADTTVDTRDNDSDYDGGDGGASAPSWPAAERIASRHWRPKELDEICRKHGIDTKQFVPLLAGDLRACSPPPAGAICVYADALEAGMRVPLQPFFSDVLSHFGVAPSQLAPNCWRVMAAFAALSRSAAAGAHPPSVAVFRHFFALRALMKVKGLYFFAGKENTVALFTGLPDSIKGWKEGFFFLKSSAPWPCPVFWGEPSKKSTADPMLTSEQKGVVKKLLRARGASAIDVRTFITDGNLAAATTIPSVPKQPPPSPPRHTTDSKGMDPSIYAMMQNVRAEKAAAAAAAAAKVSVKKRKLGEDDAAQGSTREDRKPQHAPDRHDGERVEWEVARQLLQGIVTPAREQAFMKSNPFNIIASSYVATLQAANYVTASLGHALRLQEELEKAKAELAEAKKAAAAEVEIARAAAVEEFMGSEEQKRRLVEEALKGYERGMEDMKRVALKLCHGIDPARLFVPPGGFL